MLKQRICDGQCQFNGSIIAGTVHYVHYGVLLWHAMTINFFLGMSLDQ